MRIYSSAPAGTRKRSPTSIGATRRPCSRISSVVPPAPRPQPISRPRHSLSPSSNVAATAIPARPPRPGCSGFAGTCSRTSFAASRSIVGHGRSSGSSHSLSLTSRLPGSRSSSMSRRSLRMSAPRGTRSPPLTGRSCGFAGSQEMPYRSVAEELGCTEGAARVRVTRALSRLAQLMESACGGRGSGAAPEIESALVAVSSDDAVGDTARAPDSRRRPVRSPGLLCSSAVYSATTRLGVGPRRHLQSIEAHDGSRSRLMTRVPLLSK